ncbi:hypothetical protein AC249_AIPGENE17508 [Exaiptasia diaphana]|nr:hypothetical protein AC249_AIPGENE17508 [Exaiptasia diaphana]
MANAIRSILEKIGLSSAICKRFEEEKITVYTVSTLKDDDLKTLGIQALGDRVRLKQMCAASIRTASMNSAAGSSSNQTTSTSLPREAIRERHSVKVPTASERQALMRSGLGLKKIKLELDDNEETVIRKITSDEADDDGQPKGYPKLKGIGGFEFLYCGSRSRELKLLKCARTARQLRQNMGGSQCKIYLRPIQMNISVDDDSGNHLTKTKLTEKCKICNNAFPIDSLREHFSSCSDYAQSENESTDDERQEEGEGEIEVLEDTAAETPQSARVNPVVDLTSDAIEVNADDSGQNPDIVPDNMSLEEAIKKTINHCKENNIENPLEVLHYMQKMVVTGRPLEIENPNEALEGETNFILVDRMDLLSTAFDEINAITDLRKTLEVQFYNETAQDSGGPRKEFFRIVLQEIKETYFGDKLRSDVSDKYRTIGIIFGLSILQNGNIPLFLTEDLIQDIFSDADTSFCVKKIREGLSLLGIYQVACQVPTFLYLFRNTSQTTLTYKMLTTLLKPKFSDQGTNAEKFEKSVYASFLKYLREAASKSYSYCFFLRSITGSAFELLSRLSQCIELCMVSSPR